VKRAKNGSALVEFALAVPLLLLPCMAGVDLARAFNTAMKLTGATRTGLEYAGINANTAGNTSGITALIQTSAGNPPNLSISVSQFCTCLIGGPTVSCSNTCSSKLVYVQLTATLPFQTLVAWPYIPQPLNFTRSATIRVAYPPPGGGGVG
jgi:Flp pilus assembly protein TadG